MSTDTDDGDCDEGGACPVGSDVDDCGLAPLHATQFSSCNRTAVSEEMQGLAARALVPLPTGYSQEPVSVRDQLRQQEHQTWADSCDERTRNADGGSCWADLVRASSLGIYDPTGASSLDGSSCALQKIEGDASCAASTISSHSCGSFVREYDYSSSSYGLYVLDLSGGYQNNSFCYASAMCSHGEHVALSFNSFQTERGYDFVTAFDGFSYDMYDPVQESEISQMALLHASGSTIPAPVVSTERQVTLVFRTDESITRDGFVVSYTCEEDQEIVLPGYTVMHDVYCLTADQINTTASNYDSLSEAQAACEVEASCTMLYSQGCTGSHIDLCSLANTTTGTGEGTLSVSSSGSCVYYNNDRAEATALPAPPPAVDVVVFRGLQNGSISSGPYQQSADMRWLIACNDSSTVALTFVQLSTESNFDFVDVFDGDAATQPRLLHASGVQVPSPINATGHFMLIRLTSDYTVVGHGFLARFQCTLPLQSTFLSLTSSLLALVSYLHMSMRRCLIVLLLFNLSSTVLILSFPSTHIDTNAHKMSDIHAYC